MKTMRKYLPYGAKPCTEEIWSEGREEYDRLAREPYSFAVGEVVVEQMSRGEAHYWLAD